MGCCSRSLNFETSSKIRSQGSRVNATPTAKTLDSPARICRLQYVGEETFKQLTYLLRYWDFVCFEEIISLCTDSEMTNAKNQPQIPFFRFSSPKHRLLLAL